MIRTRTRVLAGLTAAATAAGLGVAMAGPSGAATTMTLTAKSIIGDNEGMIDMNGNHQPDPGDGFLVVETLYDSSGKAVGYDRGECQLIRGTSPSNAEAQCLVTLAIPGGQLAVQGIQKWANQSAELAITGGTGQYAGRAGSVRVTPGQSTTQLTITLQ